MKYIFIFSLTLFLTSKVSAQQKQHTYFLKNDGREVELKDSADYIRVIETPDSGERYFSVKEFYQDGSKKLVGKASSFKPLVVYEDTIVNYYKNGMKESAINYKKNLCLGMAYYFFQNGKLKKQVEFLEMDLTRKEDASSEFEQKTKLIYRLDSLGKILVKDGNGHLIDTSKFEKDQFIEEGDYKNGFKDGVWKGYYASGKSSYVESYHAEKFISGVNTVDGKAYEYSILEIPPAYKGGIDSFYRYLGRSIRYPRAAYKNGISGSVHVSFIVEKDGKVSNARIMKSVFGAIDQEALRVVSASPNWIPAMHRGVPIRVKYSIPISFKLD